MTKSILKFLRRLREHPEKIPFWIYRLTHHQYPRFTPQTNRFLARYVKPGMKGFEWGAGRSTIYFAEKKTELETVEDNQEWYEKVKNSLGSKFSAVKLHLVPLETTNKPPNESAYVKFIAPFPEESFDFVSIDGRYRAECLFEAISKVKPGGIIILDDSGRQRYQEALTRLKESGWKVHDFRFFNSSWQTSVLIKPPDS